MARQVVMLRKWGNSYALTIPRHIARQLKYKVDDLMVFSVEDGALVFRQLEIPKFGRRSQASEPVTVGDTR